VNNVITTV